MKTLKNVLDTYKLVIAPLGEEDGPGFIARYEELGYSVRGVGLTHAEALAELEELTLDGFADIPVEELPRPMSHEPWAHYSGRITLRMPKMLHARVDRQADEQGVSMTQWICHILESATTAIASGREFGATRGSKSDPYVEQLIEMRKVLDNMVLDPNFGFNAPSVWKRPTEKPKTQLDYKGLTLEQVA